MTPKPSFNKGSYNVAHPSCSAVTGNESTCGPVHVRCMSVPKASITTSKGNQYYLLGGGKMKVILPKSAALAAASEGIASKELQYVGD